jgi:hypothetical protein
MSTGFSWPPLVFVAAAVIAVALLAMQFMRNDRK